MSNIDKKRLYLMIGMARFKEKNKDGAFRINTYTQRDYIAFALIRNFLLTTIAYVLVLALIVLYNLEDFLSNLNSLEIRPLVAVIAVSYLVFLGIYTVIAYILAKIRYVRMQSSIAQYKNGLSRLNHLYMEEREEADAEIGDDALESETDEEDEED